MAKDSTKKTHKLKIDKIMARAAELVKVKSDKELAMALGVAPQTLTNWKSREKIPWDYLYSLSLEKNESFEWLITGHRPPNIKEFSFVDKFRVKLSGGDGVISENEGVEAQYAFRTDWLKLHGNPDKMALFEVSGNSMAPMISENDIVLVDRNDSNPWDVKTGKTYAVVEGRLIKVKELRWIKNELWLYSSESSEIDPVKVEMSQNFRILGRVIWVGHEIK